MTLTIPRNNREQLKRTWKKHDFDDGDSTVD
jgi:hypothetical protein